jgi:hypothetical protein
MLGGRWGAVGTTAALAIMLAITPARAEDVGAVVDSWFTGASSAAAGGPYVEFWLNLQQEPGSPVGFVLAQTIVIDVVDPTGAHSSAPTVQFQYFTDWRQTPIDTDRAIDPTAMAKLRIRFPSSALAGTWRLQATITNWLWWLNGFPRSPQPLSTIIQNNAWFEMQVIGSTATTGPTTTAPAPSVISTRPHAGATAIGTTTGPAGSIDSPTPALSPTQTPSTGLAGPDAGSPGGGEGATGYVLSALAAVLTGALAGALWHWRSRRMARAPNTK